MYISIYTRNPGPGRTFGPLPSPWEPRAPRTLSRTRLPGSPMKVLVVPLLQLPSWRLWAPKCSPGAGILVVELGTFWHIFACSVGIFS